MKRTFLLSLALSFFAACGTTSVGLECTTNDQCDNGQTCYTNAPGGYCTRGCFTEGTDQDCPSGSICTASGLGLICANTCGSQGDCRDEYECNGVSGTDVKSCRLK